MLLRIGAFLAGDSIFVNWDFYRAPPDFLMTDRDQSRPFAEQVLGDIARNRARNVMGFCDFLHAGRDIEGVAGGDRLSARIGPVAEWARARIAGGDVDGPRRVRRVSDRPAVRGVRQVFVRGDHAGDQGDRIAEPFRDAVLRAAVHTAEHGAFGAGGGDGIVGDACGGVGWCFGVSAHSSSSVYGA